MPQLEEQLVAGSKPLVELLSLVLSQYLVAHLVAEFHPLLVLLLLVLPFSLNKEMEKSLVLRILSRPQSMTVCWTTRRSINRM